VLHATQIGAGGMVAVGALVHGGAVVPDEFEFFRTGDYAYRGVDLQSDLIYQQVLRLTLSGQLTATGTDRGRSGLPTGAPAFSRYVRW
jgi:hypothetical protein